jgi:hypothetical protein
VNGETVRKVNATDGGLSAEVTLRYPVDRTVWIVARCVGPWNKELFYYNPVLAHTSPVYISYRDQRIANPESAKFLMGFLQKLRDWADQKAYFQNSQQKKEILNTIDSGMQFYEKLVAGRS